MRINALLTALGLAAATFLPCAAGAAVPLNDQRGSAFVIPDSQRSLFASMIGATADPGISLGGSQNRLSIWYRMEAPASGWYYLDDAGSQDRNGSKGVLLSVFARKPGGLLQPLAEGGKVKVDGDSDTYDLSGVRFYVPANTAGVVFAASVAKASDAGGLRLNLHRQGTVQPNPVIVTPPRIFEVGSGAQTGFFSLKDVDQYAIYAPLPQHPEKIRFAVSHDFGSAVEAVVPSGLIVGSGEGVRFGIKSAGFGPDNGKIGTFDHIWAIEARSLGGALVAKRSLLTKIIRQSGEEASGSLEVTASSGLRLGVLGETAGLDLRIRNRLGLAAKGCIVVRDNSLLTAAYQVDARPTFSWSKVDPVTGLSGPPTAATFDIAANAVVTLHLTAEIRQRGKAELMPRVICASPSSVTGLDWGHLHPALTAETNAYLMGLPADVAEADVIFPDDGAAADPAPRLYKVPAGTEKRFAIRLVNPGLARTLSLDVGQNSPLVPAVYKGGVKGKLCLAAGSVGTACSGTPAENLSVAMPFNGERRLIVIVPAGTAADHVPLRLYVDVAAGNQPVAIGGFAVVGQ